ncbi:phosphocholine cytidylyltransferase family protein [Carboxylicivirga mesophila]|uniref:Phosphocholine cytidylyltransferase family protein n=1 Tax=Carboxylicivirga mesophila TaxID=1166478 RepID=A0ABS5K4Z2_9BACT|nr:phosphocholine cytidylyltransferase family protein [Carboxylicivirga mesophila]MBS2210075.1 phosphocholine cytidylyltransferase family protein [Carboxylicivirga mesophila]
MKIVILAAGIGSRLGNPFPKPLTPLNSGKTIMQNQVDNLSEWFNSEDINLIVGFKKELIMEEFPNLTFIYNPVFDQTNTSKSLLRGLKKCRGNGVLWLNGDIVFESNVLAKLKPFIDKDQSFVAVNNSAVAEEEVKYTVNEKGFINEISKTVKNALGEAVGINYISSKDLDTLTNYLEACTDNDYFERGIEMAIEDNLLDILPVNISEYMCMEVDFEEDLNAVNKLIDKQ